MTKASFLSKLNIEPKVLSIFKRLIITAVVLLVLIVNIPLPVSKSMSAVEIKLDNSEYIYPRTVSIEGKYYINIFSDNKFTGKISVLEYPETLNFEVMGDLQFMRDAGNHSPLYYITETGEDYHFGTIYAKPLFRNLVLLLFEENRGFNSVNGRCIVAGADSYDAALKIFNDKSGFFIK